MFSISYVVWFLQTWLCTLNADDTLKGLVHFNKWCMVHFPQANLPSWQVILALTTFQVPFFMVKLGQSKLYRR